MRPGRPSLPSRQVMAVLLVVLLAVLSMAQLANAAPQPDPPPLPALGLAPGATTVSGLSSGGYMAAQFHVAYAASLAGAAVLAGGPYGCSRGSLTTAMLGCSCPANPDAWQRLRNSLPGLGCSVLAPGPLASLADDALAASHGHIDNPAELARQRVWLYSGTLDTVVRPALVDAVEAFYRRHGVPASQLHHDRVQGAAHGLPSPGAPVACGVTASPYLTNCPNEDAPGELLAWLYGATPGAALAPAVVPRAAGLRRFDQRPYRQQAVFDGLDNSGWLYVPAACASAGAACRLHVVFHGCQQGQSFVPAGGQAIGQRFVAGAGYNRWAEANRIVLLYPQVLASAGVGRGSSHQFNPLGCWDFWGYSLPGDALTTGVQRRFAWREAPQLRAVKAMADALLLAPVAPTAAVTPKAPKAP